MGAALIVVMLGALFAANRIPGLERYALERNATFCALFLVFMLIPIARYLNRPMQMFMSAMIGWVNVCRRVRHRRNVLPKSVSGLAQPV